MINKKTRRKTSSQPNITMSSLQVNIDYDKLAEAFIKVQQQHAEESKDQRSKKTGFFEAVWLILRGKKDTNDHMTLGLMVIPLAILFRLIALIGFSSILVGAYLVVMQVVAITWTVNWNLISDLFGIFLYLFLIFIVFIFSVLVWGASNEIEKSKDKHFVTAFFSGIVSLVALVVSLIALKG